MEIQEDFGKWLMREIEKRGWTRSELSRQCNISHVAITNVINGNRNAGSDFCRALAIGLKMPEEKIFRLAGLLSALPASEDVGGLSDVYDMMKHLPLEERHEILDYVTWRYRRYNENSSKDKT